MVHFVGAGAGAPDLITVRGMHLLETADVVIYAGSLVNPDLLEYTKEDCIVHNSALLNLDQVIAIMKDAQDMGQTVVRLHTGDPSIYGAIREQMKKLDELGISYDVCPGVSSFQGAAASLCLEYTLPGVSQTVILTRAEGRTAMPERETLTSLASHKATMVLFLSSSLAESVRSQLLEGGLSEDTPVAIVYKATWPEEKIIRSNILQFPEKMQQEGITKTALIIVGDVLGDDFEYSKLYDAAFTTEYRKGTE